MRNRTLRLSAAALVLGAAAVTLAPHATSYVATSAVVNAPVILIRSPFDGVVATPSADIAAPVGAGAPLLVLRADRADRSGLAALEAERRTIAGEQESLARLSDELTALAADLAARRASHISEYGAWVAARAEAAEAQEAEARIRLSQVRADLERSSRLARSGSVAESLMEDDRADAEAAEMALVRARADRHAIELEGQAMAAGVVLDDAGGGLAQITYRLDEIAIRQAEIARQSIELGARAEAVAGQIATLSHRAEAQESFAPDAGAAGVIWKASPPRDSAVMTGDEVVRLLDCSRRFIEVSIPERHFERIRAGSPASVQLKGAAGWFTAEVEAVRGAGGRFDRPALAAVVPQDDNYELSVLVRLPAADVGQPEVAQAFCDVGRSADVRFGRSADDLGRPLRRAWEALTQRAAALQAWMAVQSGRAG